MTRATLTGYLESQGMRVIEAASAEAAERLFDDEFVDLAIVDILLPGKDGLQVTRELRARSDMGIILVSSCDEDVDRIVGLELGADDYVTKPFNRRELLARVKGVLRRLANQQPKPSEIRHFEGWSFDLVRRCLTAPDGRAEALTRAEYEMLRAFVDHPGEVLTRQRLMAAVTRRKWDSGDRTVDVLVRRLRLKLESDPSEPRVICTAHGEGYVFAATVA